MDPVTIVLGLGNPGPDYRDTRHNVGFRVVERLASLAGVSLRAEGSLRSRVWHAEVTPVPGRTVVLAMPRTYMNLSGRAGGALCRHYQIPADRMLVVHDDADLALGRIRIRPEGGSGGHNGVRSLVEVLGTGAFPRLRIGVRGAGREGSDLAEYVLDRFSEEETAIVNESIRRAAEAVEMILEDGVEAAMNRFNAPPRPEKSNSDNET